MHTKNSLAHETSQLEKLPYGVPLETCHCRRADVLRSGTRFLELAKGFEPPTL